MTPSNQTPDERIARAEELDRLATPADGYRDEPGHNNGGAPTRFFFVPGHSGNESVEMLAGDSTLIVEYRTLCPALAADAKRAREVIEEKDERLAELARQRADLLAELNLMKAEHQHCDQVMTQRDRWEEQVGDMAAQAGCEEEFSNCHEHQECVAERFAVLKQERNQALERAEKAESDLESVKRLVSMQDMDSAGAAVARELDAKDRAIEKAERERDEALPVLDLLRKYQEAVKVWHETKTEADYAAVMQYRNELAILVLPGKAKE